MLQILFKCFSVAQIMRIGESGLVRVVGLLLPSLVKRFPAAERRAHRERQVVALAFGNGVCRWSGDTECR